MFNFQVLTDYKIMRRQTFSWQQGISRFCYSFFVAALLILSTLDITALQAKTLQRISFKSAPFVQIQVEIAQTDEEKALGLMHRRTMPMDEGMLFIDDVPQKMCMWMKNTYVPLTVAFIDVQGRIINFADMQPLSQEVHCSTAPAKYALEMNRGWFKARSIGVDSQLTRLP